MTEEAKDKEVDKKEDAPIVEKEPYVPKDKWEEKAIASGKWKPLEEWEGDEADWRPAREYIERGELFDKIESQKQDLKQMKKVLDTLKNHHLKVKQEAMEDAIAILKKQRESAKREEDLGKVLEITEEIETLKTKQQTEIRKAQEELNKVPMDTEPSETFKRWHAENQWYKINGRDAMSTFAEKEAERFIRDNDGKFSDHELYEHVDKMVRAEFPEKFKTVKHSPKVEGGTSRMPARGGRDDTLTEAERKIGQQLVDSGVLTWEQYKKDLKKYDERGR